MNQIIQILAYVIYLKNHTAMLFQNIFQVRAVTFRAGDRDMVCRGDRHPAMYFGDWGLAYSP